MKKPVISIFLKTYLLILISLTGCATLNYSQNSTNSYLPKAMDCKIVFTSIVPDMSKYEELGEAVVWLGPMGSTQFEEEAREQACKVGGDLVLKEINGWGHYVRAIIFRKK